MLVNKMGLMQGCICLYALFLGLLRLKKREVDIVFDLHCGFFVPNNNFKLKSGVFV